MKKELVEKLAALAHEQWSGWMKYLFEKSKIGQAGVVVIPAWAAQRWGRQMNTPYADLPEEEKESDRKEAHRMINVFNSRGEPLEQDHNKDLAGAEALEVPEEGPSEEGAYYVVTATSKEGELLVGMTVWATLEGNYAPVAIRITDENGQAYFHLNSGVDYRWWLSKDGKDSKETDLRVERK